MTTTNERRRVGWAAVLAAAVSLVQVETRTVGVPPTLRRLHYLLLSDPGAAGAGYVNTEGAYKGLSARTAKARDAGAFPELVDNTRTIQHAPGFASHRRALSWLADRYALNRSTALPVQVLVLVEKDGLVPLIRSRLDWLTVSAVRGYCSVSHAAALRKLVERDRRAAVALYVGDHDPTGEDIERALTDRLGDVLTLRRIALTAEQVERYDLPEQPGKETDSRATGFVERHGRLRQVEADALPSIVLLDLLGAAVTGETGVELAADGQPDMPEIDEREAADRRRLLALASDREAD